ncbi:hypothetical protein, partial [Amycolatopsis japonica]
AVLAVGGAYGGPFPADGLIPFLKPLYGSGGAEDTGGSNPNRHSRDAPHHATAALRPQLKYVKAPFAALDAVKGAFPYLGSVKVEFPARSRDSRDRGRDSRDRRRNTEYGIQSRESRA